jgi:hypothetical protein
LAANCASFALVKPHDVEILHWPFALAVGRGPPKMGWLFTTLELHGEFEDSVAEMLALAPLDVESVPDAPPLIVHALQLTE